MSDIKELYFFLTVEGGKLVAKNETSSGEVVRVIKSFGDYVNFFVSKAEELGLDDPNDLVIMCSSSVDFPHEYTDDAAVVALCNTLRS